MTIPVEMMLLIMIDEYIKLELRMSFFTAPCTYGAKRSIAKLMLSVTLSVYLSGCCETMKYRGRVSWVTSNVITVSG